MTKKKHRIMYVQKTSGGGSTISLYELLRGLDKDLYKPIVLFYTANQHYKQFEALGVDVITLNHRSPLAISDKPTRDIAKNLRRYGYWLSEGYREAKQLYLMVRNDLPRALRLARLIKNEKVDLVHHNNNMRSNRSAVMGACLAGIPQICHVRMFHPVSIAEKYLANFVSSFIYISGSVEAYYRKQGISPIKGSIVFNPVNEKVFVDDKKSANIRAMFGLSKNDCLITNVGRVVKWKGQDYFLHAIAEVIKIEPNIKALIVGSTESTRQSHDYQKRLHKLVDELHISDHVVFTGFRADIPEIMAASDILVHSASEPEPFGRVIVEGMLAARPVIATDAGGVPEIIQDNVTGLLVPPRDVKSIANNIKFLIRYPDLSKKIGKQAYRTAKERFSVNQHVTKVQAIYNKILAERSPY